MIPQGNFTFYASTNFRNTVGDYNTIPYSEVENYLMGRSIGTRS